MIKQFGVLFGLLLLSACGTLIEQGDSAPRHPPDVSGVPDAIPRVEPIRPANQKSYVVLGQRYYPMKTARGYQEKGIASWYGKKFHGRKTATGEVYDMYQMTAAHKTLPLPSYAEVTNLSNGRSIVVRVNDRGPFHGGRIIDLSYSAASKLDIIGRGTGRVEVRAIDPQRYTNTAAKPVKQIQQKPNPKIDNNMSGQQTMHSSAGTQIHSHEMTSAPSVYLQVGTFSSVSRAEEFKKKLDDQIDEAVFLMPLYRPEGALYRVRIGPLASVQASEKMAIKLRTLGVVESHAVVE